MASHYIAFHEPKWLLLEFKVNGESQEQ